MARKKPKTPRGHIGEYQQLVKVAERERKSHLQAAAVMLRVRTIVAVATEGRKDANVFLERAKIAHNGLQPLRKRRKA